MQKDQAQIYSLGLARIPAVNVDAGYQLAPPAGAIYALITVEGQFVRWRDDGIMPDANTGLILNINILFQTENPELSKYRFISGIAGAILQINYYGLRV